MIHRRSLRPVSILLEIAPTPYRLVLFSCSLSVSPFFLINPMVPLSVISCSLLPHWLFACRDFAWICRSLEIQPGVAGVRPREPILVLDLPTTGHLSWRIPCCSYENLLGRLYLSLYRPAQHWPMNASS